MNEHVLFYDRVSIKQRAKEYMKAHWGPSIGVGVLYGVLVAVIAAVTFGLGDIFLAPPMVVGYSLFFLHVWRGRRPPFERIFEGFSRYTQSLVGILWMYLWTFLWSLLFVIPGIIKGYAYSMTPYLLADHPNLDPREALKVSMDITSGHKMEIFVMQLSFFGWMILSSFTFGILYIVYVGPYMQTAMAGQYDMLLNDAIERKIISEADLARWG